MQPAWYVIPSKNRLQRWSNLLHWPYLMWHLSYVVIGAAIAPSVDSALMGWTVLAFFFGMGISAHAFDLLKGDPLSLGLGRRQLLVVGIVALALAAGIGVLQIATGRISPLFLILIPIGVTLAVGYGLEWRFLHGFRQFILFWAVFPVMVGYLTQAGAAVDLLVLSVGVAVAVTTAAVQRILSTESRRLRRGNETSDEPAFAYDITLLLLSMAIPLFAVLLWLLVL